MKDRRNGIIQLAILVALGAAVLLSLAAPDLEGRDRSREPVEVSVLIRSADSSLWANTRLGMEQATMTERSRRNSSAGKWSGGPTRWCWLRWTRRTWARSGRP